MSAPLSRRMSIRSALPFHAASCCQCVSFSETDCQPAQRHWDTYFDRCLVCIVVLSANSVGQHPLDFIFPSRSDVLNDDAAGGLVIKRSASFQQHLVYVFIP